MELKTIFNAWARVGDAAGWREAQWLLSKWEVVEGVAWDAEKIQHMLAHISEGLRLSGQERLCDIGCGGGWILQALLPQVRFACGVDIAEQMLRRAREIGLSRLVCGEGAHMPFRAEAFDRLLCYFVVINMRDRAYVQRLLSEILRVLQPGGVALVGQIPDRQHQDVYEEAKTRYLQYCQAHFSLGRNLRDHHYIPVQLFDRQEVCRSLDQPGIDVICRESFNPFYRKGEPLTVPWRFDLILQKS